MKKTLLLVFVGAFLGSTVSLAAFTLFSDVPTNTWYTDAVNNLSEKGIIQGYSDGTFGPNKNVNRAELAVMLDRLIEYVETGEVNTSQKIVYTNSIYKLTFPQTWKGYTTQNETINYATNNNGTIEDINVEFIDFGIPAQDSMFKIGMFTKNHWQQIQSEEGPKPIYIAENNNYVFGYGSAQDAVNDTVAYLIENIKDVIDTFEFVQ